MTDPTIMAPYMEIPLPEIRKVWSNEYLALL